MNKKYSLSKVDHTKLESLISDAEIKHSGGLRIMSRPHELYKITALMDMRLANNAMIRKGTAGGYVEGEHNLSCEYDDGCWIDDKAFIYGNAKVDGGAAIRTRSIVCDSANISGSSTHISNSIIFGSAIIGGDPCIINDSVIYGNANIMRSGIKDCIIGDYAKIRKCHISNIVVGGRNTADCTHDIIKIGPLVSIYEDSSAFVTVTATDFTVHYGSPFLHTVSNECRNFVISNYDDLIKNAQAILSMQRMHR